MIKILLDKSRFKPASKDSNFKDLVKFERFLYNLKKKNSLSETFVAGSDLLQQQLKFYSLTLFGPKLDFIQKSPFSALASAVSSIYLRSLIPQLAKLWWAFERRNKYSIKKKFFDPIIVWLTWKIHEQ